MSRRHRPDRYFLKNSSSVEEPRLWKTDKRFLITGDYVLLNTFLYRVMGIYPHTRSKKHEVVFLERQQGEPNVVTLERKTRRS